MNLSTECYRLLVGGTIPQTVVQLMDDRFGAAVQVSPVAGNTAVELWGDQARLRALLSLLWDVGHQVSSVSRTAAPPQPCDSTTSAT